VDLPRHGPQHLNLFVEKGLLQRLTIAGDSVVFDPITETHHHFIDEETEPFTTPERVRVCNRVAA
jgi:Fe2+ or Zn2+ uptake regulation protein